MTILISSKQISAVSIITLWISLFPRRVAISPFTFFFLAFFPPHILSFFTLYLLLALSCSYTKERSLKDHRQSCKCSKITSTFSSFNIRSADTLVGIQIGIYWLTDVMFIVEVSNSIVNTSLVQQYFLLNITGANRVEIFINYRAASADQFNSISEIIAAIEVQINFVKKGDYSIYKTSRVA